jgi:hypothetical protein
MCTDPSLSNSSSRNVLFAPAYYRVLISLLVLSRLQIGFKFSSFSCRLSLYRLIFIGHTTEMYGPTKAPALYKTVSNCEQPSLMETTTSIPSFSRLTFRMVHFTPAVFYTPKVCTASYWRILSSDCCTGTRWFGYVVDRPRSHAAK